MLVPFDHHALDGVQIVLGRYLLYIFLIYTIESEMKFSRDVVYAVDLRKLSSEGVDSIVQLGICIIHCG